MPRERPLHLIPVTRRPAIDGLVTTQTCRSALVLGDRSGRYAASRSQPCA